MLRDEIEGGKLGSQFYICWVGEVINSRKPTKFKLVWLHPLKTVSF